MRASYCYLLFLTVDGIILSAKKILIFFPLLLFRFNDKQTKQNKPNHHMCFYITKPTEFDLKKKLWQKKDQMWIRLTETKYFISVFFYFLEIFFCCQSLCDSFSVIHIFSLVSKIWNFFFKTFHFNLKMKRNTLITTIFNQDNNIFFNKTISN